MNGEKLLDAMDYLPDELLEETDRLRQKKRNYWQYWAALAACLCLLVGFFSLNPPKATEDGAIHDQIEKEEISASTTAGYLSAQVCQVQPQRLIVTLLETCGGQQIVVDTTNLADVPALAPGDRIRIYLEDSPFADFAGLGSEVVNPIKIEIQEE